MASDLFSVPPGQASCQVSIVDTTVRLRKLPTGFFMVPPLDGFKEMPCLPSWAFFIEHKPSGRKIMFDLGIRKDWKNLAPSVVKRVTSYGWDINIEKDVTEVLEEAGVPPGEIESVIWSHPHWDHMGNPSLFPKSTELVVGPGFKKSFCPGFPSREEGQLLDADYEGRPFREIDFTATPLHVGRFNAYDYFGDGSFYLLDTPGHTIAHLAGLLRTSTGPDTFIFMGADVCHHASEVRPSQHLPFPSEITQDMVGHNFPHPCPGSFYESLQSHRGRTMKQSFFDIGMGYDIPQAMDTLEKTKEADASANMFFIFAHDDSLMGVVDVFPKLANDWKVKGWGARTRWAFLRDLQTATVNGAC